ncbi:MAG TPA: hypothetical protein VKK79_26240 [Candidatus Lokiarchaeia archaeon]|nr:hypothetical protein [Candidatus Lokiarchaeia archaeon]
MRIPSQWAVVLVPAPAVAFLACCLRAAAGRCSRCLCRPSLLALRAAPRDWDSLEIIALIFTGP